jgi:predicted nucleic acid-binding protein
MIGYNLLLDSNIILYFLDGDRTLIPLLEEKNLYVSVITQLELLSFPDISPKESETIESFLKECIIFDLSSGIKEATIRLRRKYRLKLPDAIIASTAAYLSMPLVTADSSFKKIKDADIIFYEK